MGDSQAYEAERKKQGKSPVPKWKEIFSACKDAAILTAAQEIADDIDAEESAPRALAIRRIVAEYWRAEQNLRRERAGRAPRDAIRTLCKRLARDLHTLAKRVTFDPESHAAVATTRELVDWLLLPGPPRGQGHEASPHYHKACAALATCDILRGEARILLYAAAPSFSRPITR